MGTRPYSPTTLSVLEEILKQVSSPPNYFYSRDIVDETGVSRQQVGNLLTKLVKECLLERDRGRYTCPGGQLPVLIEYVVQASTHTENPNIRLHPVEGVFDKETVNTLKMATNVVLKAQSIKYDSYPVLKQEWIDRLEQAQTALKKEIKFLRNHTKTSASIADEDFELVINFLERR